MGYFSTWFISFSLTISLHYLLKLATRKLYNTANLPPGPTPLPIVGRLFELGKLPHRSLARLAKTYGPVMSFKLGRVTTIVISSPDAAREVLKIQDEFFSARTIPDVATALGHHRHSMVWMPSSSKQWKNLRAILKTNLLTTQRLDANLELQQQKVRELIEHVRSRTRKTVNVGGVAFCTAVNLMSNTVFSVDLVKYSDSELEVKGFITDVLEEVGRANLSDFFRLLRVFDVQGRRRSASVKFSKLYKMFDEMIDQRLQDVDRGGEKQPDFLDALLQLHMQQNSNIDRHCIKSLLMDIFTGGTDTSSNVVEFAMAELLRNPSIMVKLKAELKTVIGRGREVEVSDISRLPYLQAVVKETFRIHPPAPLLIPHKAEKSIEVAGYIVPVNSRVMVNVWAIGNDVNVWEDPESFKPERFLTSEVDYRGRNFELIPFGSGRRICPGLPLGYRMVHLILGSLINSFEWKLPDGMKASDVDLTEKFGLTVALAVPLLATPLPVNY